MPIFALIASLPNTKLEKGEPKQIDNFSTEEIDALATLQPNVKAAPELALPRTEGYLTLESDACDSQVWPCDGAGSSKTSQDSARMLVLNA